MGKVRDVPLFDELMCGMPSPGPKFMTFSDAANPAPVIVTWVPMEPEVGLRLEMVGVSVQARHVTDAGTMKFTLFEVPFAFVMEMG
jgi:hypothetical protein